MTDQAAKAKTFHALHVKGDPVILFNVWDPGSAKAVAGAGAQAIATGSAPVAMAHGYADGEKMPLNLALSNILRIVNMVDLPVTMDIEGGYGVEPSDVGATIARVLETGVIGFNLEDQIVGGDGLHPVPFQVMRIAAARDACESAGINAFINARTDIFLKSKPDTHSQSMLDEAIARAQSYAQAGASGFFAPGLLDEGMIKALCGASGLPVNLMSIPGAPSNARLAELGAGRISYGPVPYRQMTAWLKEAASQALGR